MTESERKDIRILRGKGYGYKAIGKTLGMPVSTVASFCQRSNIIRSGEETSERPKPMDMRACKMCGKLFIQRPGVREMKFCCDTCRWKYWNSHLAQVNRRAYHHRICPACGKEFIVYGKKEKKYCCHECYIHDRFYSET